MTSGKMDAPLAYVPRFQEIAIKSIIGASCLSLVPPRGYMSTS